MLQRIIEMESAMSTSAVLVRAATTVQEIEARGLIGGAIKFIVIALIVIGILIGLVVAAVVRR
jgi:hypothetical protein